MKYGEKGWSQQCTEPIVQTGNGTVKGFERNGNAVFLGIPYGDNCDGENRFKAPRPVKNWEGILDCTNYGAKAMQEPLKESSLPKFLAKGMHEIEMIFSGGISIDQKAVPMSENCLNLSIVTPKVDEKKRPVLVYIHGGGFTGGSSHVTPMICDKLCDEEDVVVVSLEHRLGCFGYLHLGCFDEEYANSGLVGMLDLILALEWVRDNISAFGGDPNNVMLYGESGGGMKIVNLLAMPKAKGLFCKAYINSGASKSGIVSQEAAKKTTLKILEALGLSEENWREILKMPAEKIIEAQKAVDMLSAETTSFYCVADDIDLPFNKENAYKGFEVSEDVSVMVGSSEDEMMLFSPMPIFSKNALKKKLVENPMTKLYIPNISKENVSRLINGFAKKDGVKRSNAHIYAMILSFFSFLGGGAHYYALAKSKQKAPVYHYAISFDTPLFGKKLASAWHTADLPLSFRAVYLPEHERISKHMAHAMAQFMRTGSPSTPELEWRPFESGAKSTMVFGYTEDKCLDDPYNDIYKLVEEFKGDQF